jgi:hypothetical protein
MSRVAPEPHAHVARIEVPRIGPLMARAMINFADTAARSWIDAQRALRAAHA